MTENFALGYMLYMYIAKCKCHDPHSTCISQICHVIQETKSSIYPHTVSGQILTTVNALEL